ncbi:ketopantoate reductase family protein [Phycicoccus endophyticus]|uniref:ketopantoate reductase family protein n=1 Tax=Phycicoccus endophyticus TaxID=1690220 RepID=UPI00140D4FE1|nr:2-dehydropantoate 2-reductase N-terminal domain-containing protein [Phycicoccus endophyticus]
MTRVGVVGAGVVGQVYAGLLHQAGVNVTLIARGERLPELGTGIRLECARPALSSGSVRVPVADAAALPPVDVLILAVRAHQLREAAALADSATAPVVVTLMHLTGGAAELSARVGAGRLVRAFPGLGGRRGPDGVVHWTPVKQQPTTVDAHAVHGQEMATLLRRTRLPVVTEPRMSDWLATHAVLVASLGAGVLRAGGDPVRLAEDPVLMRQTIDAIRNGFRALRERDQDVRPPNLATLFGPVPPRFARLYWQHALRTDVGTLSIAPHVRASARDEFPGVCRTALTHTGGDASPLAAWLQPHLAEDPEY